MSAHGARSASRWAGVRAIGLMVSIAVLVGAFCGVSLRGFGIGWAILEGSIVFVVLLLGQLVALSRFGRWVRARERAERLEARNASIRAGLYETGAYSEIRPL